MNIYMEKQYNLVIKNKEKWLKHLQKVKSEDGSIEDACKFDFEFDLIPNDECLHF